MERTELHQQLQRWVDEFATIKEQEIPRGLSVFLAERLADKFADLIEEDWNVVKADINGRVKRVRVTGQRGRFIEITGAKDGDRLFGIVPVDAIVPEDNGKLADILDRMDGVSA